MSRPDLRKLLSSDQDTAPVLQRGIGYRLSTTETGPPVDTAKKIGRPKGIPKVKKTIYLTRPDNFEKAQKALVKNADILISDENELADLALALLAAMAGDVSTVKTIISIYEAEIKPTLSK